MMMIVCVFAGGGVVGWTGRALFVRSNQYRMLQRLEAYYQQTQEQNR